MSVRTRAFAFVLVFVGGFALGYRSGVVHVADRDATRQLEAQIRQTDRLIAQLKSTDAGSGIGDFPPYYGSPRMDGGGRR